VDEADSPEEGRRALAEEARRERLLRSISDMDDAAAAARWLYDTYPAGFDDFRLRIVMETGLFVTYARPFTEGRGNPPLPVAPTTGLTDEQRRIHAWAIERRKKSAAHVDRDNLDRIVLPNDVTITDPERGQVVLEAGRGERYRPPSCEDSLALAELAEQLAARYRRGVFPE
jgi:hypothetical protein